MKKIGGALKRLRAKTRRIVSRRDGGGGTPKKAGGGERAGTDAGRRQLATFGIAMAASLAVFAGLTLCEFGAVRELTPFGPSCARGSQIAADLSIGAGVGFLVFLIAEVAAMVFAELFRQRRMDAEERRAEIAELMHRLEVAELSRKTEMSELSRKVEASELSRRREAAERRAEIAELSLRAEAAEHRAEAAEHRAEAAELSRRAEVAELSHKAEVAELSRRAESERAARLELELEIARNAAKNGEGEGG